MENKVFELMYIYIFNSVQAEATVYAADHNHQSPKLA